MTGPALNTWAEILRHLGRSPESHRAKADVEEEYGDLIHRERDSRRVWALAEELTTRRHELSRHLAEEPPGKMPVKSPIISP